MTGLPEESVGPILEGREFERPSRQPGPPGEEEDDAPAPAAGAAAADGAAPRGSSEGGGGGGGGDGGTGPGQGSGETAPDGRGARGSAPEGDGFDEEDGAAFSAASGSVASTGLASFDFDSNKSPSSLVSLAAIYAAAISWSALPTVVAAALTLPAAWYVAECMRQAALPRQSVAVTTRRIMYSRLYLRPSWLQHRVWQEGRNIELGEITGCVVVDRTVRVRADGHRELVISGLAHPSAFARLVWALKRGFRADQDRYSIMKGLPKEYAGWFLEEEDPIERPRQPGPDASLPAPVATDKAMPDGSDGGDGEDENNALRVSSEGTRGTCPERRGSEALRKGVDPAWCERVPEARGLVWTDDFFDDGGAFAPFSSLASTVVAVFDFDSSTYYNMLGVAAAGFAAAGLAAAMAWICLPILVAVALTIPSTLYVAGCVRQPPLPRQHVAVTARGIVYMREHLGPSPRLLPPAPPRVFSREGGMIKFDKITDCAIVERSSFLRILRPLQTVHIETETEDHKGVTLTGLKDPSAFVRLVWAMKRGTCAPPGSDDAAHGGDPAGPLADRSR
jgi:hypothetical protein